MHLPTSTLAALSTVNSTNTTIPIPEHGACIVCNAISNNILLIQFFLIPILILIPPIVNSPQAKLCDMKFSDRTRTRYIIFSWLWVLGMVIHSTIKWFKDPWAWLENGEKDGNTVKLFFVQFATLCNAVFLIGIPLSFSIMDWLFKNLTGWDPRRFGIWFGRKEDVEGNADMDGDVPVIIGEETLLWADEVEEVGRSPEIDVTAGKGSKPFPENNERK